MKQNLFILLSMAAPLLAATTAFAYIPRSETIMNRVAHTHGKGDYILEQEVQFRTSTEPLILHERWAVENGENMRLTVTSAAGAKGSDPIRYDVVYRGSHRTVNNPGDGVRTLALSPEFIESFFHARSEHTLLTELVQARIVPPSFVRERAHPQKIEQVKVTPEPLVRLGREAGVVTWIFGTPSPVDGRLHPEAWVEQDAFTIRKLRFPTESEVTADRYSSYPSNLRFPRERTVTWDNNLVTIRVLSVRTVSGNQLGNSLEPSALNGVKPAHLPDLAQIREFYSRFR